MTKTFKGFIACLLALMLAVPAFTGVLAENDMRMQQVSGTLQARETVPKIDISGIRNGRTFRAADVEIKEGIKPDDIVTIMVELDAAPAADVYSNLKGVNATEYRTQLLAAQKTAAERLSGALNAPVEATHNYSVLFNGFAFSGEYRLIGEINALPGFHAFEAMEWESPELFNTVSQIHALEAWDLNYTGMGQLVAIIDTGCKVAHPAFSKVPEKVKYTRDDIADIILSGHLFGTGRPQMTVGKVYVSDKIPFRWNYVANNADVSHHYNDHGTHVAGIAAGNGGEIVGIAKDAQIAVMQVFKPTGGATFDNILPALEDCVVLGAASANLSLGHPCGEEDYWEPTYNEIYDRVVNAGVNLAMAAGNDYNAQFNNAWGTTDIESQTWGFNGYGLVSDPDYGVVGGPGTGPHGISVAAVYNGKGQGYYLQPTGLGGFGYTENDQNIAQMVATLGGRTLEYVMIPGFGEPADYEGLDLSGKVALVSRGTTTFVEKGYAAQDAGAIACIVYNNIPGEVIRMVPFGTIDNQNNLVHDGNEGKIPHVAITYEAGQAFASNEDKHVFISDKFGIFDAPGGNQPCDFSSWGTPATMTIKPEITAPGGGIYSCTDASVSGEDYAAWDGTSMATPHIAGGMAIIKQYVEENFPGIGGADLKNLVDAILMSTATPIFDQGGDYASPRDQGAGEINLLKAVSTHAYITVDGTPGRRPKIEMSDDPAKTGIFDLAFTIHNFGDTELVYKIEPSLLLDEIALLGYIGEEPVIVYVGYSWDVLNLIGDVNGDGVVDLTDTLLIMRYTLSLGECPCPENADINGDNRVTMEDAALAIRIALGLLDGDNGGYAKFNMPKEITVPAGSEKQVAIKLNLTAKAKDYLDEYYTSGAFIEGFLELMPKTENEPSLTVPYLGFYGDWNYAPTVDEGYYYEDIPWNSNNYPNTVGFKKGKNIQGLGINPWINAYVLDENGEPILDYDGNPLETLEYYLPDRNAISPNADGALDGINLMYMGLMRNSAVRYVVLNTAGKELDVIEDFGVCTKGFWDTDHRDQLGVNYGAIPGNYNYAQSGEEDVILRIEAMLDNDGRHTENAFTPDANKCWKWDIPIHIDTDAPTLAADSFAAADGKFAFDVTDEHYVAYAAVYTDNEGALGNLVDETGVFEAQRGAVTHVELAGDVNNYVLIGDYAGNGRVYWWDGTELVELEIETNPTPVGSFEDCVIYNYGLNLTEPQWLFFVTNNLLGQVLYSGEENPSLCESFDGAGYDRANDIVYAAMDGELVKYNGISRSTGYLGARTVIGDLVDSSGAPVSFNEMAFDNVHGLLFGISGAAYLYVIDTDTGICENALSGEGTIPNGVVAMDFGNDGILYYADAFGVLCSADLFGTGEIAEIADLGVSVLNQQNSFYVQSGCIYNNTFYWGSIDAIAKTKDLIRIDITNGAYECLGVVLESPGLQMAGMMALENFVDFIAAPKLANAIIAEN